MKVIQVIETLSKMVQFAGSRAGQLEFVIPLYMPGSVGQSPRIEIQAIAGGIDWDADLVFADPGVRLTTLNTEQIDAIMESVRKGQSWHAYQQHKKFSEEIAQLKARITELESAARSQ